MEDNYGFFAQLVLSSCAVVRLNSLFRQTDPFVSCGLALGTWRQRNDRQNRRNPAFSSLNWTFR